MEGYIALLFKTQNNNYFEIEGISENETSVAAANFT